MLHHQSFVAFTIICGLVTFSLSFTVISGDQLYENDDCQLQNGSAGICTVDIKCDWFVSNVIRKKLVPYSTTRRCGFKGKAEIVCCPKEQSLSQLQDSGGGDKGLGTRGSDRKATQACQHFKGTTKLAQHIIGGEDAQEGDAPFIAALGYNSTAAGQRYEWGCGATLISARFLLTAAHCIRSNRRPVVARMGTLKLDHSDEPDLIRDSELKNFYPHPKYTPKYKYHDIALIEVVTPFEYEDNVNRACLHTNTEDLPSTQTLVASGWGLTEADTRSDQLLKVNLTTEPLDQCDKAYRAEVGTLLAKFPEGITAEQYCAIGAQVGGLRRDSCQGDSGGPLHYTNTEEERYYLVGIISFGLGCGATASVYIRVAAYLDWIEPIVWPNSASLTDQ
ncbi:serine protease persephone-like isoform X2 [Wyeomyia smithii]|uniref:serine protease persephone-like isoform X2 n=1 Tax=Wyeomyia smithii TaxID=174621 RepID=UPI0024680B49|nr:serine protease persephone-like isoform X2 [Wyeomyia smithii]